MFLSRGQRVKLSDLCQSKKITIILSANSKKYTDYDVSCFGLDNNGMCSDDKYMIFYNQKRSPCNSIVLNDQCENNLEKFEIDMDKIPQKIKKIVFTLTIEGQEFMSDLLKGSLLLYENNLLKGGFEFSGVDFNKEKSIMVCEIYFKDHWKFSAVGSGFNGGLSSLLKHFGIEEDNNDSNSNISETIDNNLPDQNSYSNKFSSFIKSIFINPIKNYENKKEIKEAEIIKNNQEAENIRKYEELENIKNAQKLNILNQFKNLLIDYLSDGVLTNDEMSNLEIFCKKNNIILNDALSDSRYYIESFLRVMLANIISDNIITDEEEKSIISICNFLNPSFHLKNEIESTLKRVKYIAKIKSGDIKALTDKTIITKSDELVWFHQNNVQIYKEIRNKNKSYKGDLLITSERVIFKSHESPIEILLKNILDLETSSSNFHIMGKTSKSTIQFWTNDSEVSSAYLEQAINKFHRKIVLRNSSNKTRHISQSVRQNVWSRDRGECVDCSSNQYIEFDHIIPYSKGGSNSSNNIQLLCRKCNLKKSDRI